VDLRAQQLGPLAVNSGNCTAFFLTCGAAGFTAANCFCGLLDTGRGACLAVAFFQQ